MSSNDSWERAASELKERDGHEPSKKAIKRQIARNNRKDRQRKPAEAESN